MFGYTTKNINLDGTSKISGYEIDYKKNLFNNTLLKLSYTNTNAKDSLNHNIGRIEKENLKTSINYFGLRKFNFIVDVNYIGERFDRNYSVYNNPLYYGHQTGKYTLVDLTTKYKINKNINTYIQN
jgi:outer membrane cobalamin receptor